MKKDATTVATLILAILTFLFALFLIVTGFIILIRDTSFIPLLILIILDIPFILLGKHLIDCYKYLIEIILFPQFRKVRIFNNVIRHIFLGIGILFTIGIIYLCCLEAVHPLSLLITGIPTIFCYVYFFVLRAINKKIYELELFYTE